MITSERTERQKQRNPKDNRRFDQVEPNRRAGTLRQRRQTEQRR